MSTALGKVALLSICVLRLIAAQDTESPNDAIPKPECDTSIQVSIRYSSASSRLYLVSEDGITRGGCVTLSQIWETRGGKAPLYAVDSQTGDISDSATGTWLLTEELFVQDGITLQVRDFTYRFSLVLVPSCVDRLEGQGQDIDRRGSLANANRPHQHSHALRCDHHACRYLRSTTIHFFTCVGSIFNMATVV